MKKIVNKQFILSLFFFSLFIGVFVIDQFGVFDRFTTVEVVVASHEIDKDIVITEDDLTYMPIDREKLQKGMYFDKQDVIGKVSTQVINPIEYISEKHFDMGILRPTVEHEYFPIPDSWLVEIQGTLRRYDLVNISAVYVEGKSQENLLSPETMMINDYVLTDVPVVFVKSQNNEEVRGTTTDEERLNGTATPSSIELSLTLEQFKQLEKLYNEGYQFILSYK